MGIMINFVQKSYYLLLISLILLISCDIKELSSFGSEDSGFSFGIRNYSIKEYNNCILYMGYLDSNYNFEAIDSLSYDSIVIYKKGDGDYNETQGYSSTDPFRNNKNGLNKYGYWEPDQAIISRESVDGRVYFKINLEGKTSVSSARAAFNGHVLLKILENGDLSW